MEQTVQPGQAGRALQISAPDAGPNSANPNSADLNQVQRIADDMRTAIESVIEGKRDQIDTMLTVLFAGGHLLVQDVPGVGKTMLAKALGKSLDASVRRIQFTPDLLPSDVIGVSVFNQQSREFEFKPGGIFANVVLGDEINRASPKTQSAMLEAMAEQQISVDGVTMPLPAPFIVIATQNPIEMEGTYPLPEAQRDRFMACIEMGYPPRKAELKMLDAHGAANPLAALRPVTDAASVVSCMAEVSKVYVADNVKGFILDIIDATRSAEQLRLGASPRAGLHLLRAARSRAALQGRSFVTPDDVLALVEPVLAHRLLPAARASARLDTNELVRQLAADVPVPQIR